MSTFIEEITLLEARLAEVDGHLRTMGSMLDIAMDGVDKRDALIAELRGRIARLEQEAEGYLEANTAMHAAMVEANWERDELLREVGR